MISLSADKCSADQLAREWFVRLLDDDISVDDLAAWKAWLDADPRNRAAYEQIAEVWGLAEQVDVARPTSTEQAADTYRPEISVAQWRSHQSGRPRLVAAAWSAAAVCLLAGAIGWAANSGPPKQIFATGRAEHMRATLSDGSQLKIAAMTRLSVGFGGRVRAVGLERGEALFEVARDKARPFIVKTPLANVEAVGTAFDIDVGEHSVVLQVTEGVVSVDASGGGRRKAFQGPKPVIRVEAGQRLRMERFGSRVVLTQSEASSGPTWTEGRLEYRDESLASIVEDVNRYLAQPIIIADPTIGRLSYTGTVQLRAGEAWVEALAQSFPLTVELNSQKQFVLRRKKPDSTLPLDRRRTS